MRRLHIVSLVQTTVLKPKFILFALIKKIQTFENVEPGNVQKMNMSFLDK